jgi:hypothetical protein
MTAHEYLASLKQVQLRITIRRNVVIDGKQYKEGDIGTTPLLAKACKSFM